jgi:hypothetical protein
MKAQIESLKEKEYFLLTKLDEAEAKTTEENRRLMELYEDSSRYKDLKKLVLTKDN